VGNYYFNLLENLNQIPQPPLLKGSRRGLLYSAFEFPFPITPSQPPPCGEEGEGVILSTVQMV
jgi:hypothetical protein